MTTIDLTKMSLWQRMKACWLILRHGQFTISSAYGTITGTTGPDNRPITVHY
jgi:hypothetical protein